MKQYTLPCIHQFQRRKKTGKIGTYFFYTHTIYIAILRSDCVIPEAPVRSALCYTPLTRCNYSVVSASGLSTLQPSFSIEFILIKCPNSIGNVLLILMPTSHTRLIQSFHCLPHWGKNCFSSLWLVSFSVMVSLVASPNGLITSRRQTISVSVSPTPYESFIGHLPGVTFSANCSLSILCQLYYRCLFKTVCARNNSPNKDTASDEKDMFSHHKGLIYLNLSS